MEDLFCLQPSALSPFARSTTLDRGPILCLCCKLELSKLGHWPLANGQHGVKVVHGGDVLQKSQSEGRG